MGKRASGITVRLEDGREYDLEVALEEREPANAGAWAKMRRRARRWLGELPKVVRWLLALAIGALVANHIGNAIADDYADRQRERELDAAMVTKVSRGAADLYGDARHLSKSNAPEQQKARQLRRLESGWLGTSAEIDAFLDVYHPDGEASQAALRKHWRSYQGALYQYGTLACCTGAANRVTKARTHAVNRIRHYVLSYEGDLDPIFHRVSPQPLDKSSAWEALKLGNNKPYYNALGLYLLQGPAPLGQELQKAKTALD